MFGTLGATSAPAVIAGPNNSLVLRSDRVLAEPLAFAKSFPVQVQQYTAFQPLGRITSTTPQGWAPWLHEYLIAKRFPANEQLFAPNSGSATSWF